MMMEDLTVRLYQAWQEAIAANKLMNVFQAPSDDPEGRWLKGESIVFGIHRQGNQYAYYAQNRTQDQVISGAVEEKQIDPLNFICQFNGYRALRPGGQHRPIGRQADISATPKDCRFFCQDPTHPLSLLIRTPLLQIPLNHFIWKAYYNAAPIEPNGHFLWIPTPIHASADSLQHIPQYLTRPLLDDALILFQELEQTMLFFNSLHAGASVNHIHFQAMLRSHELAIESCSLIEEDGYAVPDNYPAHALIFPRDVLSQQVFSWIDWFQTQGIPFNLMMLGQRIILIPRNIDHEIVSEFPGNGLAALGMCGKIVTVDRAAYLNVNETTISQAFQKMTLSPKLYCMTA